VRRSLIVTATGPSSQRTAEKFEYARCATDPGVAFEADDVDLVFVATQHDSHARFAETALRAGKAVWLEKPAAITPPQLEALEAAVRDTGGFLTVGYNRRFSPHARAARDLFAHRGGALAIHYTVAAGPTPRGTWLTDPSVGGGRIVGEACHFVDFFSFLVGVPPVSVASRALGRDPETDDSMVSLFSFPDGSTATLHYLARASDALPKERWEASADGCTASCENFRQTRIPGRKNVRTLNQDKGHDTAVREVIEAIRSGKPSPFGLDELLAVSRATFAMHESARTGRCVEVG